MANISNTSTPSLGFSQGSKLDQYAGKLDVAKLELSGRVPANNEDSLRLAVTLKGGLKKSVDLARDYILKGVSAGATGDRILGQLGLSVGGKFRINKTSLLGRGVDNVDGPNYRRHGFPYSRYEVNPNNPVVNKTTSDYIHTIEKIMDPSSSTAEFVDINSYRNTINTYILNKQVEDASNYSRGVPGVLSMAWVYDKASFSEYADLQKNENIKNTQRRLSILVFNNYPSSDYEVLTLPYIPAELSWVPQNTFADIAAFSRNVPDYQYLGSSQEFSFEIDWYSNEGKYEEIVKFAKLIDSYSRSDGYSKNPPIIKLAGLFGYDGYFFHIKNAPYRITEKSGKLGGDISIYPRQIIQTITLQRISPKNPTWEVYEVESGDNNL